jgi:hypothetical protein
MATVCLAADLKQLPELDAGGRLVLVQNGVEELKARVPR